MKLLILLSGICLSSVLTGALLPRRRYRYDLIAKARKEYAQGTTTAPAPRKGQSSSFSPTSARCCKIGEKAARKKFPCHVNAQVIMRRKNLVRDYYGSISAKKLSLKMAKCTTLYAKTFVKCCTYRQGFVKQMLACKALKGKLNKRACRKMVRKRFP